jgi:hypothetical protein
VVLDGHGAVVRSRDDVEPGDRLRIRVHGGELAAVSVSGKDAVSGEDG